MKKLLILSLCTLFLILMSGCQTSKVSSSSNDIKTSSTEKSDSEQPSKTITKIFTKKEDLPKEITNYSYFSNNNNKNENENFVEKDLRVFLNNFGKDLLTVDYTKEDTFIKLGKYLHKNLLNSMKQDNINIANDIKNNKIISQHVQTNINSITYDNKNYYADCTYYMFIKNGTNIPKPSKFYKKKFYLKIEKENNNLYITSYLHTPSVHAEEIENIPTLYQTNSNLEHQYLNSDELNKLSDINTIKKTTEKLVTTLYNTNYKSINKNLSELSSCTNKDTLKNLKNNFNDINKNKLTLTLDKFEFKLINYSSNNNAYTILMEIDYHNNTNNKIKSFNIIDVNKIQNQWKICYFNEDATFFK